MENAREILQENILGSVATVNEDGSPWATPVHIFFDDEAVYWFSHTSGQHSKNVARDPRVSVTVWSPDESKGIKGVYVSGTVQALDVDETEAKKQLVVDRIGKVPSVFDGATAYKLPFGELNREKSYGNCWYFYS